jgi:dipeptidase E
MKLYLSSYRFGDQPHQLADLVGGNKKIAIIPNALDIYPDGERKDTNLQKEKEGLTQIGLQPEFLDLRSYFGKPEDLRNVINQYGAVWVLGGNTFVLRRAYKESGLDIWLQDHKSDKEFVYAGYSAGVCVLSPELKGLEIVDEPNNIPEGYKDEVIWEGVGLIDFAFAPHFESPGHPETEMVSKEVEYMIKNGIEHRTLHDGQVIIMEV